MPIVARMAIGWLGPAFVAAVAYVDPGNVAANMSAGGRYGYLLIWVLVAANVMAGLVQYLSAKIGIVTGQSLPELLREHLDAWGGPRGGRWARRAYWAQAELVALATDMAEVLGGAVALQLLFGLPLVVGGVITGGVSLALLTVQSRHGQRAFELVVMGLLAVIGLGFVAGLAVAAPPMAGVVQGLVPRLAGPESLIVVASMVGATVMPHAVYVHSALARDRHGRVEPGAAQQRLLRVTRQDVVLAMVAAGGVNIGMLLVAATALRNAPGTETLSGVHAALAGALGPVVAGLFAVGLLVSGLASTAVGCYAGATIMGGLLRRQIPLAVRRLATLTPALVLLALGVEPTLILVMSQVALSFGIPLAIIPLIRLTAQRRVMGAAVNHPAMTWTAGVMAALIVGLNAVLIGLMV